MIFFSEEDKKYIIKRFEEGVKITNIAKEICLNNGSNNHLNIDCVRKRVSNFLSKKGISNNVKRIEDSKEYKLASKRILNDRKYYIVTWEQNETPLHLGFWKNILAYKEFLGAELAVILGRYKNPTSVFTDKKYDNWNKETKPYWDSNRHDIHKYLTILSDVKISPTKKYPLTGVQGLSQGKSIIVGHPKLHLKTEPTLNGYAKKMLFTTGAVTLPNYTDSGAGAISNGVHKFGFVIIEIENDEVFYIRQVEALEDGSFIDLCYEVKEEKVYKVNKALGMVCGDTHHWQLDKKIDKQNDVISRFFNIDNIVFHDVVDGESCNNHKEKSAINQFLRYDKQQHLIDKELNELSEWISTKLKYNPIIPQANHNDRFDRILDNDWRKDIPNSLFYLEYTQKKLKGEINKGVLAYFLEQKFGDKVKCLDYRDSFKIGKYECSQHGDYGANGAKGSPIGFRSLEIPIILAHSHVPYRADDCFYVGTNTHLYLDYNLKGSSSWVQSNVLIAKNGVAQHIIFVKGNFTTFDIS